MELVQRIKNNLNDKVFLNDKIDIKELSTFIKIVTVVRTKTEKAATEIQFPVRHCTIEDFKSRGMIITQDFRYRIAHRLCPNIPKNDPNYKVENLYYNRNFRRDISMQILKCNSRTS